MGRSFRKLAALALVAWGGFWATPPPARADFELTLSEAGSSVSSLTLSDTSQGTPGVIQYSGNFGNFWLQFTFATSNSPGTAAGNGIVTIANTNLTNKDSVAHTLTISVSSTGFITPGIDQLYSTASGSITRYSASGDFTSYVDRNNTLFGTSDIAAPTLSFSGAALTNNASFSGTSISDNFSVGNNAYSITNVSDYTLAGGGSLTLSGGNSETVAPAPSGVVLALSGVPLLAVGCWLRRRRGPVLSF